MTEFPKEYPRTEIQQVLNYVNNNDTELDRLVLAIYGLIGYSLSKMHKDAQLTSLGHEPIAKIGPEAEFYQSQISKITDPDFIDALNYIKNNPNFITDLNSGNLPSWIVPVLYKLVDMTLHSLFQQTLFKSK